jgi:hypothetical protein
LLPAENNVIGQFVGGTLIRVWEMQAEGFSDFGDYPGNGFGIALLAKTRNHEGYFLLPELFAHFFMDALVSKNSQLAVLDRHINQNAVTLRRLVHFEMPKNLHGPVQWMNKTTLAFHEYPNFPARLLFGQLNSFHYLILLSRCKEILFLNEWDTQAEKLNNMIRILHRALFPSLVQTGNSPSCGNQTFLRKWNSETGAQSNYSPGPMC